MQKQIDFDMTFLLCFVRLPKFRNVECATGAGDVMAFCTIAIGSLSPKSGVLKCLVLHAGNSVRDTVTVIVVVIA